MGFIVSAARKKRQQEHLNACRNMIYESSYPKCVAGLIDSYIGKDNEANIDSSNFEIRPAGSFFIHQFVSNCHWGMTLAGFSFGMTGMIYLSPVCLLLDLLIYFCKIIYQPNPRFDFYVTSSIYYTIATISSLLSTIICAPLAVAHATYHALNYKLNTTRQLTSGKEIYALLRKLEIKDDKTVDKIISNIREAYKERFHSKKSCFDLLFRDNNSEQLYQNLRNPLLDQAEKTEAIEEFMKSKNKNAGKGMFHIILDRLEFTPDETEEPFYHDYPMNQNYDYRYNIW